MILQKIVAYRWMCGIAASALLLIATGSQAQFVTVDDVDFNVAGDVTFTWSYAGAATFNIYHSTTSDVPLSGGLLTTVSGSGPTSSYTDIGILATAPSSHFYYVEEQSGWPYSVTFGVHYYPNTLAAAETLITIPLTQPSGNWQLQQVLKSWQLTGTAVFDFTNLNSTSGGIPVFVTLSGAPIGGATTVQLGGVYLLRNPAGCPSLWVAGATLDTFPCPIAIPGVIGPGSVSQPLWSMHGFPYFNSWSGLAPVAYPTRPIEWSGLLTSGFTGGTIITSDLIQLRTWGSPVGTPYRYIGGNWAPAGGVLRCGSVYQIRSKHGPAWTWNYGCGPQP